MKRLFKFLVATATTFSLLIANTPLTQIVVRADGDEPSVPTYTFTSGFVDEQDGVIDRLQFVSSETVLMEPSEEVFPAGTINVTLNQEEGAIYKSLRIVTRVEDQDEVLYDSASGTGSFSTNSDFRVVNFNNAGDDENRVGILEIVYDYGGPDGGGGDETVYTVTVKSSVVRTINFVGCGLVDGERKGDPQLNISQAGEYPMTFLGMPEEFTIENPGGMGVEEVGRLVKVIINGHEEKVTARYDSCTYSLKGLEPGDITIELEGDDTPGGVIEWTNSGCPEDQIQENIKRNHEEFQNGSARVVGVYKSIDDIGNPDKNIMSDYGIEDNGALFDEYNGCLRIENGYWIAFEFVPLPGYQLVEFGGSAPGQEGIVPTTDETINVYYFQMPQGNCHFTAKFDKPENIVKITGNSMVDDGAITVAENEFEGGTAMMTVGALDGNTRSAYDKNNDVQAALDKDNLEIEEYLSLDLANIYQKANTDDYWEEEYHELTEGKATVSLVVDDNFNPGNNKVYIVHDKGGDEGIETIPAVYNPNTHEITFETGSFSNFMIATSDEANDVYEKQNDPPQPGEPEPGDPEDFEDYAPHFSLALVDDEVLLGNWEGEDSPFFVPVDEGQIIPSDAAIDNELPEDLPDDIELIYFIDDEEVASYYMDERETFTPGHFVVFEGIAVAEDTFEVYFKSCWIVAIDVIYMDLSMTVQDKDGKVIEPINVPEDVDYPVFECGDATKEDYTFYELAFITQPAEVVVKGINGYAIFYLGCNDEDVFNNPIGENYIKCPDEDYIWIGAWGIIPESETVDFTYSLSTASAVFDGVSADKAKDYLVVIDEIELADAPAEDVAAIKKQLEEKGYTGVSFPMGFEINLFDKNGSVHEPGFTVRITLVLKKALELKDGEKVWILHLIDDDKFEVIEAVYNATNLTLTFETKTFSPFVVMIGTQAAPAPVVKTGEDINVTRIVIASLLIGAAAAAGILFIKRREYEIEKEEN